MGFGATDPNNTNLIQYYRNFRNTLTQTIKKTKTFYYQTEILKAGNNIKRYWELINEASNRSKQIKQVSSIINEKGTVLFVNKESK